MKVLVLSFRQANIMGRLLVSGRPGFGGDIRFSSCNVFFSNFY